MQDKTQNQNMNMEDMEEKKQFVMDNCTCEKCPTYMDCSEGGEKKEKGFCFFAIGKSKCIEKEKGCICGGCTVYAKMGLKNQYYCVRDSEMVQKAKK